MRIFSAGTDPAKEKWDGARTAPDDLVEFFGADEAEPIAAFPLALRKLAAAAETVYMDVPNTPKRARAASPRSLLKVRSRVLFRWLDGTERRVVPVTVGWNVAGRVRHTVGFLERLEAQGSRA